MSREVIIQGATFIVNDYSRKGATETLEELLRRVIVQNAEKEFRKDNYFGKPESSYYRENP